MKTKKDFLKLGLLVVFAACLITGNITGTYAKFTSTKEATDVATMARWAFNVNDKNIAKETFDIDVFDGEKVAPGSSGQFTIDLENISDVDAKYTVDFEVDNFTPMPIEFTTNDEEWFKDIDSVTDKAIASGATDSVVVKWKWNSVSDENDTNLGTKDNLATISVKAIVTAYQAI